MGYDLPDDYVDVAERVREFRTKHPDGSLQQHDLQFVDFGGKAWVIYTAAAYRTPDDPRPGMGTAWEQVPGKTPFTRDSELQNAETAAWGRAIVAALAADTKRIASADEVYARRAPEVPQETPAQAVVRGAQSAVDAAGLGQVEAWAQSQGVAGPEVEAALSAARARLGVNAA